MRGVRALDARLGSRSRRVLKPGGYLLAFGAPRTFHRLVAGIEDAGLEVRDQLHVALRPRPPEVPATARTGSAPR